ncbi:MAG: rhamnan synthesis F family protein [Propionibacteriaceae bacterium]|jgi:lipopolysaccharide biosynthesis protein|nr:rhamnan synthesis F family protein [Propionibacteriaceae bacterium]
MVTTLRKAWRILSEKGPKIFARRVNARLAALVTRAVPATAVIDDPERDDATATPVLLISTPGSESLALNTPETPRLAVQLHVYFSDIAAELLDALNHIPYPYDCFISTDSDAKANTIQALFANCTARQVQLAVLPNRGRDIAPLLTQLSPVINDYRYIAHAHTKRSVHVEWGDEWRHWLLNNTFGQADYLRALLAHFEELPELGIIIPETFPRIRAHLLWDHTQTQVRQLLDRLNLPNFVSLPGIPLFPAGDFFWARTAAVRPLFELHLSANDFEPEDGQIRLTLAHVIERSWKYLAQGMGYDCAVLRNASSPGITPAMTIT